jgi:2-succinyl-5-enolpyruvyl-6-hydroxy-3-cyclohexene-1-carboxylate synthase
MSAELLGVWVKLALEGAIRAGVSDVVIAPGSRSTPFALAALRHPGLRCHSIIDERSAAFFAVGQARLTNRPTLVLCTSGTAGAHFLPAAVEAAASFVPLLLVTADRPFSLHDCGAPQTVDQTELLGKACRRFVELGEPVDDEAALWSVHHRVVNAALATRSPVPGPVHINARVGKPLEPPVALGERLGQIFQRIRDGGPLVHPPAPSTLTRSAVEPIARDLAETRRGLILCGALPTHFPASEVHSLARQTRLPLVAEAASQARFRSRDVVLCDGVEALLLSPSAARALRPDVVLQVGAGPLAPAWNAVLERVDRHHVLHPHAWADPTRRASSIGIGNVGHALQQLRDGLGAPNQEVQDARQRWSRALTRACQTAWRAVAHVTEAFDPHTLGEAAVLRQVSASLPADGVLALGNSLPIRELDRFAPAWATPHIVATQRGVNGIDGLISGAAGLASVRPSVTLVLGDVSFLHDIGGLWATRNIPGQLVVVVINNGGGRIFEQLPVATSVEPHELAFWTTPHHLDLSHAAHLFEVPFERAATAGQLDASLHRAYQHSGCTIVEARVSPDTPRVLVHEIAQHLESLLDPDDLDALQ